MNCLKSWLGTAVLTLTFAAAAAKVGNVKFEQQGVQHLPNEQLSVNIQLQPGSEFRQEILDEDVKRLYNTGNFADVVSEVRPGAAAETFDILFKIKLKPRISAVKFSGNVKYPEDELREETSVFAGSRLNDKELRESAQKLRQFYIDKGYTDATVTPVILPEGDDQITLTWKIEENLKQRINDVVFEGATLYSQWNLRHSIATQYSYMNLLPFINEYLNRGLLNRSELDLDRARLRDKYHDAGYLDFKIEDIVIKPTEDDPEYVDVTFKVTEGEPYLTGKCSFTGNTVYTAEELLGCLRLEEGKVFSRLDEEATAKAVTALYETLGYADISCRPVRRANFENHTVDVDFEITEGRKYSVRDVVIVGNTRTKDKVIRRELAVQPGDPVDKNRIEISKQRLMGMGYFEKVETNSVAADALDEKDVHINVTEKADRFNFRVGAGASDTDKVFGMAEISTNNFDLFNPGDWFYGGGQRMRVQGIFGVENAGFNVDFVEPWLLDLPIRYELSGYMNQVEYDEWTEERVGVRTSVSKRIFDDFTSFTLGYKFEYVNVTDIGHRLENYMRTTNQDGHQFISQPSFSITRDTRDSYIDPTSGYHLDFFGAVSPKMLGSSTNFYRLEGKGSCYYNFWDGAIVLMGGAKIGTVSNFDRNDDVPVFERYFLGGGDSLRGFDYRSVSPTVNRESVGGQTMLLLTAEASHPIYGPVRGAAFVDAGNVWSNSYCMGFSQMNIGAGYGLRIKVPVLNAPIKLDLAYPVLNNQDTESSKLRFHFNVGFTF